MVDSKPLTQEEIIGNSMQMLGSKSSQSTNVPDVPESKEYTRGSAAVEGDDESDLPF